MITAEEKGRIEQAVTARATAIEVDVFTKDEFFAQASRFYEVEQKLAVNA